MLPFVAMPDQVSGGSFFSLDRRAVENERRKARDAFRLAASSSKSAPVLERIKVRVETYGWNDFAAFAWEKICGQLTRNWARTVCDDSRAALNQALPKSDFYLVDDRNFDLFNGHETLGREVVADQLRAMDFQSGRTSLVCDVELGEHGRNCTAAVPIAQHLVAVWWVWEREGESAEAQADREGRAIGAFVKYALGAEEDFAALWEVVCTARRPGSDRSMNRTAPADPCPE